jgi:hypothetical protein
MNEQTPTRLLRPPGAEAAEFARRVTLFVLVMNARRPAELAQGFADLTRDDAEQVLREAKEWSSSQRQARISVEFGTRPDQHEALTELVGEASPALRHALHAHMTPTQQARFSHLAGDAASTPAMGSLAARLVREATR